MTMNSRVLISVLVSRIFTLKTNDDIFTGYKRLYIKEAKWGIFPELQLLFNMFLIDKPITVSYNH